MQIIVETRKNKKSKLLKDGFKYSLYICINDDFVVTCYSHIIDIIKYLKVDNIDFLYKYNVHLVNGNLHFKSLKKANLAKQHIESIILMNKLH